MLDDIGDGPRLTRYIAGECTPEEAEEIRRWIAADPSRAELVDGLTQGWEAPGRVAARWDVDAVWREFVAARAARQVRPLRAGPAERRPQAGWRSASMAWSARIAAALVLVVSGGLLWRAVEQARTRAPAAPPLWPYAAGPGESGPIPLSHATRRSGHRDTL